MKRSEIVGSLTKVLTILKDANLSSALSLYSVSLRSGVQRPSNLTEQDNGLKKAQSRAVSLQSMRVVLVATQNLDENDWEIISMMKLDFVFEDNFWNNLISEGLERQELNNFRQAIHIFEESAPNFISVLKIDAFETIEKESKTVGSRFYGQEVLRITVIEDETFSKPERLSAVLTSVSDIYEACSIILDVRDTPLSVIACDSGSDKSFDFLGAAQVMDSVRGIFLDVWDRVVFYRERKHSQALELVAKSLPILNEIGELENSNRIGREQAEMLRRTVSEAAMTFVSAGAMTPDMKEAAIFEPRQLMAPAKKYLSPPQEIEASASEESVLDDLIIIDENEDIDEDEGADEG